MTAPNDPPIQDAATVVLARDAAHGLELLLLRRNDKLVFAPGCWVFPGGRVDHEDLVVANQDRVLASRIAAVRETYEETGIHITPEQLTPFAHWTTPPGRPRRFATWFYITQVTNDIDVTVDGGEIEEARWLNPAEAHQRGNDKTMKMMTPTATTLRQFANFSSTVDAVAYCQQNELLISNPGQNSNDFPIPQ